MIRLENNALVFSFPELHEDAQFTLDFQRTLRIPDDGKDYPLPAGLGRFPVRHVDDFAGRLESRIVDRGGVCIPMHASEAMWISFDRSWGETRYPFALKVAAGKINAISGSSWSPELNSEPQDYLVIPAQPWLDGFAIDKAVVRQFVAERLGDGYSVEEQLTGRADFGGLQLLAYPMKRPRYLEIRAREEAERRREGEEAWRRRVGALVDHTRAVLEPVRMRLDHAQSMLRDMQALLNRFEQSTFMRPAQFEELRDTFHEQLEHLERRIFESGQPVSGELKEIWRQIETMPTTYHNVFQIVDQCTTSDALQSTMGMAAGGRMRQEVYADPYGIDAWDQGVSSRCFLTLLRSDDWTAATGEAAPTRPPTSEDYAAAKVPWFDYYDPAQAQVGGSSILNAVKSWATLKKANKSSTSSGVTGPLRPIKIGPTLRADDLVREPRAGE